VQLAELVSKTVVSPCESGDLSVHLPEDVVAAIAGAGAVEAVPAPVVARGARRRVAGGRVLLHESSIEMSAGACVRVCVCVWPVSRVRCAESSDFLERSVREEMPAMSSCTLIYRCVCVCVCVCDSLSLSPSLTLSRSPSGSRDGWEARDFHSRCDGKGATLTVVRSEEGYVFGGYASVPWASSGGTCVRVCMSVCTHVCVSSDNKPDTHAFIYTLTNKAGLPAFKAKATKEPQYAVRHCSGYLPSFGFGPADLHILPNAHTKAVSCTQWGRGYPLPPGAADKTFLVGHHNFKVAALEVFLVE
jgi:hypothetical protein